jgi:hypothetical protein
MNNQETKSQLSHGLTTTTTASPSFGWTSELLGNGDDALTKVTGNHMGPKASFRHRKPFGGARYERPSCIPLPPEAMAPPSHRYAVIIDDQLYMIVIGVSSANLTQLPIASTNAYLYRCNLMKDPSSPMEPSQRWFQGTRINRFNGYFQASQCYYNGRWYIIGQRYHLSVTKLHCFDPLVGTTGKWLTLVSPPRHIYYPQMRLVGSYLHNSGDDTNGGHRLYLFHHNPVRVSSYNIATNQWRSSFDFDSVPSYVADGTPASSARPISNVFALRTNLRSSSMINKILVIRAIYPGPEFEMYDTVERTLTPLSWVANTYSTSTRDTNGSNGSGEQMMIWEHLRAEFTMDDDNQLYMYTNGLYRRNATWLCWRMDVINRPGEWLPYGTTRPDMSSRPLDSTRTLPIHMHSSLFT